MKKKNWLILLCCTVLLGGWLLYSLYAAAPAQTLKITTSSVADKRAEKVPIEFEGLTVSSYTKGELQSRVKIKSMRAAPRKIMVFQVKSLNELLLFDVHAEIFENETEPAELLPLGEMQKQLSGVGMKKAMGRITQARMLRFSARFTREGKETLHLEAQEGIIDFQKHNTALQNASLFQPSSQRKISSSRIDWDTTSKRFIIPGEYQERQGDKLLRGSGISVGTDFSISPLPSTKTQRN
jgi:hypothetical protein